MNYNNIFFLFVIFVFTALSNDVLYAQTDIRQQTAIETHSIFPFDADNPKPLQRFVYPHEQTSGEFQNQREMINLYPRAHNKGTTFQSFSGLVNEAWARQYASGLASSIEVATAIVVDYLGNVIVTGSGTSQGSSNDYVTIKYDAAGNQTWVARYDGPGSSYDYAEALVVDELGNIYVTGYSWDTGTSYDYATIKYDASTGTQLWVARYDGTGNVSDYAYDIALDGLGNVYVTGSSMGSGTSYDYATIKYDASGNQLWAGRYNGPWDADDGATALEVYGEDVYVTGFSTGPGTLYDYATLKYDALGNQLWVARYDGPGFENDIARDIAVDESGNAYVTGVSVGLGTWDDFATIKYDALGNQLWVARYNGPGMGGDGATALALDGSGNVYVTGYCWSALFTMDDYATIKYDTAGNQLWVAFYDGSMSFIDRANAIAVDGSGNVYVTGIGTDMLGMEDYATIKYDTAGNQLWVTLYNGPATGFDWASALAVDGTGNVYVTGYSYGVDTRDDYATLKYDASGIQQWVTRYDGPGNSWDQPNAMVVDGSGNVYVTGTSTVDEASNTDYVTIKYDSSGNQLWVARYVTPGDAWGVSKAISVDGSGNVYVTGYVWFSSIIDIDYITIKYDAFGNQLWIAQYNGPDTKNDYAYAIAVDGSGNVYITGASVGIGSSYDYFTIKYDASGNQLWDARYDGPGNAGDYAYALTIDGSGNVYVTGKSRHAPSGSTYDYATIKYDASGNQLWIARYIGTGDRNDVARAIEVDGLGNVYVTGSSRGSGSLDDYVTIKYDASGNQLWVARYNGPDNNYDKNAGSLAVDGLGNVYVTGSSWGAGTTYDYLTIKYDSSGNQLWEARYNMGPGSTAEFAAALAIDVSGNVYVTGNSFDGTTACYVTIKYDTSGNQLWVIRYNGPGNSDDHAEAIVIDVLGNVYVTGDNIIGYTSVFGTVKYIQAAPPTTFQLTVDIEENWNMVSIPGIHPVDQNVNTWWAYRDTNTSVYEFVPGSGYNPITVATPTEGYWMKHTGALTYNTGDEWPAGGILYVPYDPIDVAVGWNMIGGYDYNAAVSGITPEPVGNVYRFSNTGGYFTATELVPGYGYWLKSDTTEITLPGPTFKGTSKIAAVEQDWGKIIITDQAGKSYTLYAVNGDSPNGGASVDLNNYELPPTAPAGLFDVRYGSGRYVEDLSSGEQTMLMQGIEYPVRVKVEGMTITLQDASGEIVNANLSSGEEVTINNSSVNKLMILSGEVEVTAPIEYALEQNYPNPFNPSTTIKFSVPEATNVTLNIYNVLGEKVSELVNTKLDAGRYSYQWDAGKYASGLYIYVLRTESATGGGFVSIKKMILLR